MKRHQLVLVISLFIVSGIVLNGCGKKAEDNQQSQQSGEQEKKSSGNESQNPFDQLSQAAEEMNKAFSDGDRKPVPPVNFKTLMTFLPTSYNDMNTEGPEGETASYGEWNFSQAKIRFNGENTSAEIEIFDYAHINLLYAPFKMFFNMKIAKESSKGYEKSMKFGNHPGFIKWESMNQHSEITLLVGDRFIVKVETHGLGENASQDLLSKLDLDKLATATAS